ncbi:MBL fold metallo-hydrolase [Haematobacter genomosp. 1]|uniref:MBL fold metallo-hydrolase n=2 Tax=Haematobacter genomosp. 1 TaxID=366618 RepID=A0A212AE93_9RHOB|nr:MBL fold metallo-hydrolase [Haematobacter genomosp. 1]
MRHFDHVRRSEETILKISRISDRLSIFCQPDPADFPTIAQAGFARIVDLLPKDEASRHFGSGTEQQALAAGLAYDFIPVRVEAITRADIAAFARATAGPGQVLAYCATGQRALLLHVLAEALAGRMSPAEVIAFGQERGHDLALASAWLERDAARSPVVEGFYDPRTSSVQYVVSDPATRCCAIIDPVHDFDEKSGATRTENADRLLAYVAAQELKVEWILDTHPHADHFSAAAYLRERTGAPMAIGAQVLEVQKLWRDIYNLADFPMDGSPWDRLFAPGDTFRIGSLEGRVMASPGHTLASITYIVGDAAFIHDTLFMPDGGSARADFPGGSAEALWRSICDILALPDETRLFTGHDYLPGGRHPRWESTPAQQKRENPHVMGQGEAGFLALRKARDATLPMPKLILPALQVNLRGGRLPEPESNGIRYLKIPLDVLPGAVW